MHLCMFLILTFVFIIIMFRFFFFFQAEDGIRDYKVTGVQTCALPISRRTTSSWRCAPCSGPTTCTWFGRPDDGDPYTGLRASAARAGAPDRGAEARGE